MPKDPDLVALRGRLTAMTAALAPSHDDTLTECFHIQLNLIQKLINATIAWIDHILPQP